MQKPNLNVVLYKIHNLPGILELCENSQTMGIDDLQVIDQDIDLRDVLANLPDRGTVVMLSDDIAHGGWSPSFRTRLEDYVHPDHTTTIVIAGSTVSFQAVHVEDIDDYVYCPRRIPNIPVAMLSAFMYDRIQKNVTF